MVISSGSSGRRLRRGPGLDHVGDWLHLVGDVGGEAPLTHWGKYQARQLGELLSARARGESPPDPPKTVPVPQVIFTDPQVASVGLRANRAVLPTASEIWLRLLEQ